MTKKGQANAGRARLPLSLAALSPARRRWLVAAMAGEEVRALDGHWPGWAHDGQVAPTGNWRTWVIMAGRGFGKTRAGAEWVRAAARDGAARIALVAASLDEARAVMVEGVSGLLTVAGAEVARWWPGRGLLVFRSGAEARLYSGAHAEGLRGPEHSHAWCDELAKWPRGAAAWDNLQLGLRLGAQPRALVTTTPRLGSVLEAVLAEAGTVVTGGATGANPHLPTAFVEAVTRQYGGTRWAGQEIEGQMPAAREGALWTRAMLDDARIERRVQGSDGAAITSQHGETRPRPASGGPQVSPSDVTNSLRDGPASCQRTSTSLGTNGGGDDMPSPTPPAGGRGSITAHPNALSYITTPRAPLPPRRFVRLAVGVDPPAGGGTCGILVCAVDGDGVGPSTSLRTGFVLEDASVTGASPEAWAAAVAGCWQRWREKAEQAFVVAEVNQGGEMVRSVLRAAEPDLPIRLVRAREGKVRRAEPVALLFEQRRVRLCGRFEALEAELLRFVAGGGVEGASPDRADAMVWALTALMVKARREPRVAAL